MKLCLAILFGFLLILVSQSFAAETEEEGYLSINSVTISLKPGYADVHAEYSLEEAFRLLAFMFGENDIRTRLLNKLAFSNATITSMNYSAADLIVYDVEQVYGDGLYWFPAHTFGCEIPEVIINTNLSSERHENIGKLENGIVYY
ncbi:hypothetical protein ACKUB1_01410 [Methanospirillum stamsii]|uniref:Uncharacterized protein n=1 Tax=Methanospirillum stamsii TaxID=1277351 RepID=A0A2V2NE53_9EURY|nr:hypothetical protein [Methanospirillum stamsii]PWR74647.1 hypothetical protein DLD82_08705 [Methanospirillum stamsii]